MSHLNTQVNQVTVATLEVNGSNIEIKYPENMSPEVKSALAYNIIANDRLTEELKSLFALIDNQETVSGIDMEIDMLREAANAKIDSKILAREYCNRDLSNMPMLVNGEFTIAYKDDKGKPMTKLQSRNTTLWLIALYETIENGFIKDQFIGKSFFDFMSSLGLIDTMFAGQEMQSCVELASKFSNAMIELNIINRKSNERTFRKEGKEFTTKVWSLTEAFSKHLEELREELETKTHYLCKPLRHKPMEWKSIDKGIGTNANLRLIPDYLSSSSYISAQVLRAVNLLQSVPFEIHSVLARLAHSLLQSLDKPVRESYKTEGEYQSELGKYENTIRLYSEVSKLRKGTVYFAITCDQRGRMYYRGGDLTPQGNDYCKALLQFKNKVKLGSKGLKAIVLQVANSLGIKGSITKRLSVVNNMYKNGAFKAISSTIEDITIIDSLKGDKWQAFVAILELNRVMELIKSGVAKETIESQLVVHQDGTCNGLQHISAFVKDRKTAGTVNLLASTEDDTPKDIYGLVVDNARKYVLDEHMHIVDALGRELGKKPVMVGGYGATIGTQKLEVLKTILEYLRETNTDIDRPDFLASAIVKGIEDTIPAISKFTNAIKAQALSFLQNKGEKIEWRTIDGFRVITEYRDIESKMVRTIEGGLSACISYDTNGDKISTPIDEVKTAGALSPNFVHSNDAAMVRETVIEVNKSIETEIVAIHDSIGCHAGNYERVSKAIRRSFVKLFTEYNMLESLAKCLDKEYNKEDENDYLKVIKFEGDFDIQETLNSTYLFS